MTDHHACVLVPHYNHHRQFERLLPELAATGLPIVVCDDASERASYQALERACAGMSRVTLCSNPRNLGKGGAVMTAMDRARAAGFTHGLQIDADGQHDVTDIPRFLEISRQFPDAVISGKPVFADDISPARYYGRKVTVCLVAVETLSLRIADPMCGFRVYPLEIIGRLLERRRIGMRMDFDVQLLVECDWQGVEIRFIETRVAYPEEGLSHFDYIGDNLIISRMHARLLLGMLPRLPRLVSRHFRPGKAVRA